MRKLILVVILLTLGGVYAVGPAAAQERGDNGCLPALNIAAGDTVTIIGGVYIRAAADLDSAIVAYSPDRIAATVIGGPICADGFNWWQVERIFEEPTFRGW
ncbi:MAG: hypothetical protein AAF125_27250, partial [Chloroflexota bacterium]